jgi:hypothetical protein
MVTGEVKMSEAKVGEWVQRPEWERSVGPFVGGELGGDCLPREAEQPAPKREPVAGWNLVASHGFDEVWELRADSGDLVARVTGRDGAWTPRLLPAMGDRRAAMLASEDDAVARERGRVEVLGYRMVRK